jgi:hypothetical protein
MAAQTLHRSIPANHSGHFASQREPDGDHVDIEDIEDIEHGPGERERRAGESPEESPEAPTDEDERAWQQALLRARTEFADEDTDVVIDRPEPEALAAIDAPAADAPAAAARTATSPLPPPRRKRRTSRPYDAELPPQTVTVRRQRQTGRMDLVIPAAGAVPPVDLVAPAADAPAPRQPASPATPPAPSAPSAASAVARVLADGAARSRERSREREALERVLALAKPRSRHTNTLPAALPPQDDDAED